MNKQNELVHRLRTVGKLAISALCCASVGACALPVNTRETSTFKLLFRQQFEAQRYDQVKDCVLHGFNGLVGFGFPDRSRVGQQTFTSFTRVEMINGTSVVLASVDIYSSGNIEFHEAPNLIGNTGGEQKVILGCIK